MGRVLFVSLFLGLSVFCSWRGQASLFQLSVLNTRLPINNVLGLILFPYLLLHKLPFLAFHIIYFLLLVQILIWISLAILAWIQNIIRLKNLPDMCPSNLFPKLNCCILQTS